MLPSKTKKAEINIVIKVTVETIKYKVKIKKSQKKTVVR